MRSWPIDEAKVRFCELLDACTTEGPQLITCRGTESAVLVPIKQWRRLRAQSNPSMKDLLLAEDARTELEVPARGLVRRRPSIASE